MCGVHCRGYLPHVKVENATYFVTFRMADSLPKEVYERLLMIRSESEMRAQTAPDEGQRCERWTGLSVSFSVGSNSSWMLPSSESAPSVMI